MKMQFTTDSWNTAKNISTVDRCAIPSVTDDEISRNNDVISTSFFSGYSKALVQEAIEVFDSKAFMAALHEDVVI